jgi:hypothetical protein
LSEADEARITGTMIGRPDHPFALWFVQLDEIAKAPGGKFKAVRSELDRSGSGSEGSV